MTVVMLAGCRTPRRGRAIYAITYDHVPRARPLRSSEIHAAVVEDYGTNVRYLRHDSRLHDRDEDDEDVE